MKLWRRSRRVRSIPCCELIIHINLILTFRLGSSLKKSRKTFPQRDLIPDIVPMVRPGQVPPCGVVTRPTLQCSSHKSDDNGLRNHITKPKGAYDHNILIGPIIISSNHSQLLTSLVECVEGKVEITLGMGARYDCPDSSSILGHHRIDYGKNENLQVEHSIRKLPRQSAITDHNGCDGGLALASVKSKLLESFFEIARVVP